MTIRNIVVTVAIIFVSVGCSSVSNPDAAVNRLGKTDGLQEVQVDSIASVLSKYPDNTQLSIAIVSDSSTYFYGAMRDRDTLKTINNADKVFEIGSLTKVFTSALLTNLEEQGALNIDDPISEYVDFQLKDTTIITFKQLSNHTSGLPRVPSGFVWEILWNMDNPYKNYTEEKLRDYLKKEMELQSEPGKAHQYSNLGAGTLGYVLVKASNQTFEELLQEHIFRPFNMRNSTTDRAKVENKLVKGLSKRGNVTANWDLRVLKGAGAVVSTARDMSKFVKANFDSTNYTLIKQHQKTFSVDASTDIGLGWFIMNRDSTEHWHWHNGGTGGYRSSMFLDIDNHQGVVVLSNISAGHSHASEIDALAKTLLESLEQSAVASK